LRDRLDDPIDERRFGQGGEGLHALPGGRRRPYLGQEYDPDWWVKQLVQREHILTNDGRYVRGGGDGTGYPRSNSGRCGSLISTGLVKPNSRIEAAICATCWSLCVRAFLA
jgi:hypothetical protein